MEIDENAPGNRSQQAVTRTTDNETGHDPSRDTPEVPLPPDDEAPVEEDMSDVDAANSVTREHPDSGSKSGATDPSGELGDGIKEPRNMPASDPESGA
ncbi:MatE family transporter [Pseudomonas serboccidentalis]